MVIKVTIGNIEPKLEKLMDGAIDLLYGVIRTEAIGALGTQSSDWPVKTGLSKGAFDADIKPPVVSITNATTYAQFVEDRTGAARQTLERHFSRGGGAARAIERELTRHLAEETADGGRRGRRGRRG